MSSATEWIGVDKTVVMDWVRLYQLEGARAFLPQEGNRRYDPTAKEVAVRDYAARIVHLLRIHDLSVG